MQHVEMKDEKFKQITFLFCLLLFLRCIKFHAIFATVTLILQSQMLVHDDGREI